MAARSAKAHLSQSQDLLAEFLSALGTGYRVKEFLPAEVLHLAEGFWRARQLAMACLSHSYCSLDKATHTVLPLTLRVQG
jgi:hypothetical protein